MYVHMHMLWNGGPINVVPAPARARESYLVKAVKDIGAEAVHLGYD